MSFGLPEPARPQGLPPRRSSLLVMHRLSQRLSRRFCTGGALLPPRAPLADRSSSHRGTHHGSTGTSASADDPSSQHARPSWRRLGSSRPPHPHGAPVVQASSPQIPFRCLTPACSGLASLAADARRYTALDSSERRVRAACQLADSRHAGSLLRTTGEPRRGRCEKGTGATASFASRSSSALPLAS